MHRKSRLRAWFPAIILSTLVAFFAATFSPVQQARAATPYIDYALSTDGTSSAPSLSSATAFVPGSGDFTVELWAMAEGTPVANSKYFLWFVNDKGLYVKNGTFWWRHDDLTDTDTGVRVPTGWFDASITATSSTKEIKLFINGTATSWSKTFTTLTYAKTNSRIGADTSTTSNWVGQLDQVKVFSSVLTADQISQSKDTYKTSGITNSPTLFALYDMNTSGTNSVAPVVGTTPTFTPTPTSSAFAFKDVKTIDTASRSGKTIYKFPRTYLNAEGGFKPSSGFSATYEYLAVAGGGGGGGNRGGGGGAGGLLSGNVTMPYNGAFQVVVGSGGYSSANGSGTVLKNVNATTNLISTTGGGAGGTHAGASDGVAGGSGGGTSLCGLGGYHSGGAGVAGQGHAGATCDSTTSGDRPTLNDPYPRGTGGGGGAAAAGVMGRGTTSTPTANTVGDTRPDGGAGSTSTISGTTASYAAGGGGAIALGTGENVSGGMYSSAYFGLGGSSIGGNGADVSGVGALAAAFTGSGGGGGGTTTTNPSTSGGYGSGGILYLVASAGPVLTTPAAGALLNSPTMIQPTVTVPSGTASITGCSAVDANGSSAGVSVLCTPVTSSTSSATLTDLKFTTGTTGQYYTVILTINGFDEIRQEMYLGFTPANITIAASGATSNFVWDGNAIVASADNADIVVLNTDVQSHLKAASIALHATTKIQQLASSPISGTTSGNGILYKAKYLHIASNLSTVNGAITFWSTNPNVATGTTGVTGVLLDSSSVVSSSGGAITVGGGSDPFTEPVTAEVGFKMNSSSKLNAADGNISIRANSVANSNFGTGANFQIGGMMMTGSNVISTTGLGSINISVRGDGVGNRVAYGLAMWGSSGKISAVNGDININAGNLGSGSVLAFSIDNSGEISTSGSGNITIVGDGRGTSNTSTANPGIPVYGVAIGLTSSGTGRSGTYNKIKTVDGNISITGYGSSHIGTTVSYSIPGSIGIWNYGFIQSTGAGAVSLAGYGGNIAQGSTYSEQSLGLEQTGLVAATTGAITLTGKAGVVSGTPAGKAYGIVASKSNYSETYLPGTIQTTSGSITISGDTSGAPSGTNAVQQYGYFEQSGQKIISSSGSISLSGTVCSSCSPGADYGGDSYGVVSYTFGTGSTVWHEITTGGNGNIEIVGRSDNKISSSSSIAYGVYLESDGPGGRNTVSTSAGSLSITGTAGGQISRAVTLLAIQIYSGAGNMTVSGTSSGSGAGGIGASLNTTYLKTLSGQISLTGKNIANVASGTMGNNTGLSLSSSSVKSGDAASSPTVTGGTINIEGQVPEDTTGTLIGISWAGTPVDSFSGIVNVLANAGSSVANANRIGLRFVTSTSVLGARSAELNFKVYGSGTGSSSVLQDVDTTFGSALSHANFTIEVDSWNWTTQKVINFDTDGWINFKPISTSFKPSKANAQFAADMVLNQIFYPSTRVSKLTIGKPGNTMALTINSSLTMSTDSTLPDVGNLVIYAGDIDSGVYAVKANTLSVNSSGKVALSATANLFNRVAVVRGSATNFAIANTSTSWQAGNFNGVTGVYGVPTKMKFIGTPPTSTPANTATSFSVQAADAYDVAIASANTRGADPITVSVSRASGASTSLGGTSTVSGTAGTSQTFSDITFDQKGNHTIAFDATGFSQLVSSNINVTNGPPTYNLSYFSGTNTTTFVSSTTTASPSLTTTTTGAKTWSVLPAGSTVCSINSTTGVVTTLSAGTCQVRLATALDANYTASSVTITLTINKSNQASLVISTTSGTFGSTLALSTGSSGSGTGAVTYAVDSGTCSVSGSTLTLGNAGDSCMVTATKAGDTTYNDAVSVSTSITTNKASQTSLVAPSGVSLTHGDSSGLSLSSLIFSGGSGSGSLSFSTATVGCSISSGVLTSTKNAGTSCIVTTTKASETNYNSASVDLTVNISKANQAALTITSTSGTYGSTITLTTSGGTDNGTVSYVVDSGTCAVAGATLTLGDAGTSCMVTATKASTTNYNSVSSSSTSISTAKADQAILAITSTNGTYGTALTLTTSGGTGGGSVTFVVDSGTCSVTAGVLSLGGAGDSCMVTATKASTTNYNSVTSASTSIATAKANQVNLVAPSGVSLTYGDSSGLSLSSLVFTGGSGSGAISFTTSTPGCSIASAVLTSSNNATTICTVSGTKAGDSNYNIGNAANLSVTIARAAQPTISITSASTGTWGTDITLTSSGSVGDGALTYSVVSGSICSVTGPATLASTGAGTCVIKASVAQGTNHLAGSSANFTVTLAKKNQATLGWPTGGSAINTTIDYGATRNLSTTGGSGTGTIVYTRSASSECTVIGNVVLASADAGSVCEIVATKVADSNYYSADSATLTFTIAKIAQASISWTNASSLTYGQTLNLNAIGGSGDGNISYGTSGASNTAGCSVTGSSLSVTSSGSCTVTAQKASSTNYLQGSQIALAITVNKAIQTVAFTSTVPATPIVGDTYSLSAQVSSGGTAAFSVVSGGCSVTAANVTFTGAGNCLVAADVSSTSQYLAASRVTQTIAVGQQNQTLAFATATLNVTTKTFGDTAFVAQASSSVTALAPVFTRGSNTTNNACLVTSSGVVSVVAVGTCEILADQPGDTDTAAASTISKTFQVVADLANAPAILSVSAGHQSITAAFVKPSYTGGASVTGYELVATYASGSVSYDGCAVVAGSDQSCTISGLDNGTPYTVKVAAINSAGKGAYSNNSASRTPATNPAAVSAFTAIPDNTRLVLSWQDPISLGGGTFDSYRIFYKRSSDASYPGTYITVNSQSPTGYTITGLINGEAYDAKIVTVTTANTVALESNTAEVRETPRTVPDAPALVTVFEAGANLVISWLSPVSDGGAAITAYAATISGTSCVLATPTDTTCTISAPSAPGVYAIEVKARNDAGYSSGATQTFVKAGVPANQGSSSNSNPGSTNGGNEYAAPGKPQMQVISFSLQKFLNSGGQKLSLVTRNMNGLKEVLVNGNKARILKSSDTFVSIVMPKSPNGPATLLFRGANGQLEIVDAVTYVNGKVKPAIVSIKGYVQAKTILLPQSKVLLKKALASAPETLAVTCIGYQSWAYDTPLDAQTAIGRAKQACSYLKSINPKLSVKTVIARTNLTGTPSRKLAVQFRAIK